MSIHKINNDAFESKGNNGGPEQFEVKQKSAFLERIRLKKIEEGILFLGKLLKSDDKNIFRIKYSLIPPKSNRLILRETIQTVNDVPQKGIKTFVDDEKLFTNLYYELSISEIEVFIAKLKYIVSNIENFRNNIHSNDYDWLLLKKVSLVEEISLEEMPANIVAPSIIRIIIIPEIVRQLRSLKIIRSDNYFEESNIIMVNPHEYAQLIKSFPNIIIDVLSTSDIDIDIPNIELNTSSLNLDIDSQNDQVVGVIDSGLDPNFPLMNFIDSTEDKREFGRFSDFKHGSWVSSLIIANDELNPGHADNLGNFKVRHFEVLEPNESSSMKAVASFSHLYSKIAEIVKDNLDIKIWNLSLGGSKKPFTIMMSPLAILLDKLSYEYNILFCVAAGNDRLKVGRKYWESLNQPADSLNSLSVGSVTSENDRVTYSNYSSIGPILHFEKPEVSEWGGPNNRDNSPMGTLSNKIIYGIEGTSFSTPRISRLAAYYIQNGLSPFEAKAKIISLARRETPANKSSSFGYIDNSRVSFDLSTTISLGNNKPIYLPIILIEGIEKIIITTTHKAKPNPNLGEEYCIFDLNGSLIWYEDNNPNPEYASKGGSKSVSVPKNQKDHDDKPRWEHIERFDGGKYFTTHKKTFYAEKINDAMVKCITEKGVEDPKLAVRLKKLNLFPIVEEEEVDVSVVISFIGAFNHEDFYAKNESIIEINIDQEVII